MLRVALLVALSVCLSAAVQPKCEKYTKLAGCPRNLAPVCGSNLVVYNNECMLCKEMEAKKLFLHIVDMRECQTSDKLVSSEVTPACHKYIEMAGCPKNLAPVCGSNLVVYNNECMLCKEMEAKKLFLHIVDMKECQPQAKVMSSETSAPACGKYTKLPACPYNLNPVCGSNLVVYSNECELCKDMESKKLFLHLIDMKECKPQDKVMSSETTPACHKYTKMAGCPKNLAPVCGSNLVIYNNECMLCKEMEAKKLFLHIVDMKECLSSSALKQIITIPEGHREANCPSVKSDVCPMIYAPVCTNLGEQFPNECELCRQKFEDLSMNPVYIKDGECLPLVKTVATAPSCQKYVKLAGCPKILKPVCGSNLVVYNNECLMCQEMREKKLLLQIVGMEECLSSTAPKQTIKHIPEGHREANCPNVKPALCPKIYMPVCTHVGEQFVNECDLCRQKFEDLSLDPVYVRDGECKQ